jgi:hypothetical protein
MCISAELAAGPLNLTHRNAKSYPHFSSPALPCVGLFLAPGIICSPQTYPLAYVPTLRALFHFLLDLPSAKR